MLWPYYHQGMHGYSLHYAYQSITSYGQYGMNTSANVYVSNFETTSAYHGHMAHHPQYENAHGHHGVTSDVSHVLTPHFGLLYENSNALLSCTHCLELGHQCVHCHILLFDKYSPLVDDVKPRK